MIFSPDRSPPSFLTSPRHPFPSSLHRHPVISTSPRHLHISPSPLHPLSPLRSPVTSSSPLHPPSPPHSLIICASHRHSFVPSSFLRPPRHSGESRNPSDDRPRRSIIRPAGTARPALRRGAAWSPPLHRQVTGGLSTRRGFQKVRLLFG